MRTGRSINEGSFASKAALISCAATAGETARLYAENPNHRANVACRAFPQHAKLISSNWWVRKQPFRKECACKHERHGNPDRRLAYAGAARDFSQNLIQRKLTG